MALASMTALLIVGAAPVAVQLERLRPLDDPGSPEILAHVEMVLRETGRRVVFEPASDPAAPSTVSELLSRTGASEVLVIRVLDGATLMRIDAERFGNNGESTARITEDSALSEWKGALRNTLLSMFPPLLEQEPLKPPDTASHSILPWVLVGGGVAGLGVGLGFAIQATSTRSDVEVSRSYDQRGAEELQTAQSQELTSALFLAGGVLSVASGVLYAALVE